MTDTTTKQVIPNPTGKGGFQDHPELRSDGRWKAENSQQYCLNKFLSMTEEEFIEWGKSHPDKTVAQIIAYTRVTNARNKLNDYKEIINRTEGMPKQSTDITSGGDKISKVEFIKIINDEVPDRTS